MSYGAPLYCAAKDNSFYESLPNRNVTSGKLPLPLAVFYHLSSPLNCTVTVR